MSKLIYRIFILSTVLIFISCGTAGIKERKELRKFVSQKKFSKAIKTLSKGDIKKDKHSKVLYFMEMGRLYYGKGDYSYAADWFNKAKKLIDDYYTKSIGQKVASKAMNENLENYYGEVFEVSILHYYLAKSYYNIYLTGKISEVKLTTVKGKTTKKRVIKILGKNKSKQYLYSARAEILAWDSFYKDVQRSGNKTIFKSDLLVKLFGATLHEAIGSRSDLNTALQLYQDAKKVLYTVSNILETYNKDYKKYTADRMDRLGKLVSFMPKKSFKPTTYQNKLKDFIDGKILNLTKRLRPGSVKKIIKQQSISKKVVQATKKTKRNVTIFLEEGLIAEKKAKIVNIGLKGAMESVESPMAKALIRGVGVPLLSYFAMNTLGLVPKKRAMTYGEFVYARGFAELAVTMIAIEFEIPLVEKPKMPKSVVLKIYKNNKGKAGKLMATKQLAVVAPIGDIARQNLEESAAGRMITKGMRVAMKHVVAIAAAYTTKKAMKQRGQDIFASTAASVQYFASAKGILATERADIRYWSTLPSNIHMTDLSLKRGSYLVKIEKVNKKIKSEVNVGEMHVTKGPMNIFTYYVPQI
jgi:hypothetical protein